MRRRPQGPASTPILRHRGKRLGGARLGAGEVDGLAASWGLLGTADMAFLAFPVTSRLSSRPPRQASGLGPRAGPARRRESGFGDDLTTPLSATINGRQGRLWADPALHQDTSSRGVKGGERPLDGLGWCVKRIRNFWGQTARPGSRPAARPAAPRFLGAKARRLLGHRLPEAVRGSDMADQ